jgi:hypothetical protein
MLISLLLSAQLSFSQVPDTETFSLQDVVNEVNPSTDDLVQCFADATTNLFDPAYYDTGDDLLEFRNYGAATTYTLIADPDSHSFSSSLGSVTIYITIDPDDVPVVVSKPTWISTSYSASFDVLTVTAEPNSGGPRIGSVELEHPQDSNTTEIIFVDQAGGI